MAAAPPRRYASWLPQKGLPALAARYGLATALTAPGMLEKVFELFTQEQRSGMGGNTGLGIGLALVRRLVQMHGGQVQARSEGVGRGASFEIRLPLGRREADAPAEPAPSPAH